MLKTNKLRERRRMRQRTRVKKTAGDRLRLSVFRSNKTIYAQVIDDRAGLTVAAASTLDEAVKGVTKSGSSTDAAVAVGKLVAERAAEKGVGQVYFDRGSYLFHGRVKALADAAREAGLKF